MPKQITINADEMLEKLFSHIESLVKKEKQEYSTDTESSAAKQVAGKLQAYADKLEGIKEEIAAREAGEESKYLSEPVRLKLEAATLRRKIAGLKTHGQYYSEY